MEEYFFQTTPKNKNKMNYSINNDDDTIVVSIKNNTNDKISFFMNKLEKIELKMETILISLDNVLKYNKQLEDKVLVLTNKLVENEKEKEKEKEKDKEKDKDKDKKNIKNLNYNSNLNSNSADFDFYEIDDIDIQLSNSSDNIKNDILDKNEKITKPKKNMNKLKKYLDIGSKNNLEELNNKSEKNNNIEFDEKNFDKLFEENELKEIKELNKINDNIDENKDNKKLKINKNTKIKEKEIKDKEIKDKKKKNNIIESNNQQLTNNYYREIKKEIYNLDKNFIKECLSMNNIDGEIKIFQKIYIENTPKEYYPIRNFRKKMQFWLNEHMNDDPNGNYIKNTIVENIENIYLSINKFENYEDNTEQFFKNQEYISKLGESKYRDRFLNLIIDLIKI